MYIFLLYITISQAANLPITNLRTNRLTSNALSPNGEHNYFHFRDWVKISEAPPQIVNDAIGARVELECEAVGSPEPTIQWLKGTAPVTEVIY